MITIEKKEFDKLVDALNWASVLIIRGNMHELRDWQENYYLPACNVIDEVKGE